MTPNIRKVAVMMPFGGNIREYSRRSVLDFKRIEYIIECRLKESVHVAGDPAGEPIEYQVQRFDADGGVLHARALELINEADILIGLVTEENVNVAYELAFRNILQDLPIMLVADSQHDFLPVYFNDVDVIDYPVAKSPVGTQIDALSVDDEPISLRDKIPAVLQKLIDDGKDEDLENALRGALARVEKEGPQRQPALVGFVSPPPSILQEWHHYYPMSVVETKWRTIGPEWTYLQSDMVAEPRVVYWNREFLDLYNLDEALAKRNVLTQTFLVNRLRPLLKPGVYDAFINDQIRLTERIVFGNGFATASVPIHLADHHDRDAFKGKTLLPCLIAKWADRKQLNRPHRVYLVVSYIYISESVSTLKAG